MEFVTREGFEMVDRVGQQLGNYRLMRLIGQGGFASVYLGEHIYLQTQAAIKVLQMQLASNALESFLTEARTVARLRHPFIVGILEFGVEDNTPFLVMEYAPNGSLRQRHPKGTRLSPTDIVPYVKQITSALQYAHDEKLIHRDIKPENLLLGADNEVLLADFGIALIAQTHYQKTLEVAGTLAYMAPEQLRGKPRQASDQYALGIVVYEWLSGSCPFHGSFAEVASQHIYVPPPSLRSKVSAIPPSAEEVVMTALAKDPQQRFASVQAFANALEQACKSGPSSLVVQPSNPPTLSPLPNVQKKGATQPSPERNPPQLPKTVPQQLPPLPAQQKPQQRRGLSAKIMTLLIILALLVIGGSGLIYYTTVVQPTKLHAQATATVQANVSSTTRLYDMATNGSPDLNDPLKRNSASGWVEFPWTQGDCAFRGAYHSAILQKDIAPCLAQRTSYSDFAYQVQLTIITGDEGGLIFRSNAIDPNHFPFSTNYYLFGIGHDGRYSLSYQGDKSKVQLISGSSSTITTGLNQPNLLTVVAHGSNISLYVNRQYLAGVSDSNRSSGAIGVFAQDNSNPTDVAFSNAYVWTL